MVRSLARLLVPLLYASQVTYAKSITWLPSGSGDLHNIGNWDSSTLPTDADDIIINIKANSNDVTLSLSEGNTFNAKSISASGHFLLNIESTIKAGTVDLKDGANMRVTGAELHSDGITINSGSKLMLDSVVVKGSNMQLNVRLDGELAIGTELTQSGNDQNTATHITGANILVAGKANWYSGALILDNGQLNILPSGTFNAHSGMINTGNNNGVARIDNSGTLTFTAKSTGGDNSQILGLALHNTGNLVLASSNGDQSTVRVLNDINLDGGTVHVGTGRTLQFSSNNHTIGSSCTVVTDTGGAVQFESGTTVLNGKQTGAGSYNVNAALYVNGQLNIPGELAVKAGQIILNKVNGTFGTLTYVSGMISGIKKDKSVLNVLNQLNIVDTAAAKVLSAVGVNVYGTADLNPQTTLLAFDSSQITVQPTGVLNMHPSTSINSDASAASLLIMPGGKLNMGTDADSTVSQPSSRKLQALHSSADSSGGTSIAIGVVSAGHVSLYSGDATFKSSSSFTHMHAADGTSIHLQGSGDNSQFKFTDAVELSSESSQLIVSNAKLTLDSAAPSHISQLSLFDSTLISQASLQLNKLMLGSPKSNSKVQCNADIVTDSLQYDAGDIVCKSLTVQHDMLVQGLSSKQLRMDSLILTTGSTSSILATNIKASESMVMKIERNSSLSIGSGVTLEAEQFDTTGGKDIKHPKLINDGTLLFTGSSTGSSVMGLNIDNNNVLRIQDRQSVQLNSLVISSDSSQLQLRDNSVATLNCPMNATSSCKWTTIDARDSSLVINLGPHEMYGRINASVLTVAGGHTRLFKAVTAETLNMQLGDLTTHSSITTTALKWTGGAMRGYSAVGSSLIVSKDGTADMAHSNDVALDGLNLINAGDMVYHGADIVLSNGAQIINTNKLHIKSNANMYAGNSDSGSLVNYGTLFVDASPTLHTALTNRGIVELAPHATLTLDSLFTQDASTAELVVAPGSAIVKQTGPLSIAHGTLAVAGNIKADLNLAGRLQLNSSIAHVDGDVVFGDTALYNSSGGVLQSSKAVYLAGSALFNGAFDAVQAKQIYNVFASVNQDINATSNILQATGKGIGYHTMQLSPSTWSQPSATTGDICIPQSTSVAGVPIDAGSISPGTTGTLKPSGSTVADPDKSVIAPQDRNTAIASKQSHALVLGMDASAAQSMLIAFIILFAMSSIAAITMTVAYYRQKRLPKMIV